MPYQIEALYIMLIIYIHRDPKGYWKICEDIVGGRNTYGIIDTGGYISGKSPNKLPYFPKKTGFQKSQNGSSRINGGSKFSGWVNFGSYDQAIEYLREHFVVRIV